MSKRPGHDPEPDDDAALFRAAVGEVRELAPAPDPVERPRPRPRARMAEQDELDARSEFHRLLDGDLLEAGDALRYRRDEVSERVLRRLSQGQYAVQDEVDLHWSDAVGAEALLREFLLHARNEGIACIRVIHGKGLHSDGTPVLKNLVDRILRRRADVLAFHSAPVAQGGTGAVLVLLKPGRRGA